MLRFIIEDDGEAVGIIKYKFSQRGDDEEDEIQTFTCLKRWFSNCVRKNLGRMGRMWKGLSTSFLDEGMTGRIRGWRGQNAKFRIFDKMGLYHRVLNMGRMRMAWGGKIQVSRRGEDWEGWG